MTEAKIVFGDEGRLRIMHGADALANAAVHPFYGVLAATIKGVCTVEAEEL